MPTPAWARELLTCAAEGGRRNSQRWLQRPGERPRHCSAACYTRPQRRTRPISPPCRPRHNPRACDLASRPPKIDACRGGASGRPFKRTVPHGVSQCRAPRSFCQGNGPMAILVQVLHGPPHALDAPQPARAQCRHRPPRHPHDSSVSRPARG